MIGQVDDLLRALVEVHVTRAPSAEVIPVVAWIDTAFNGQFVLPRRLIEKLKLEQFAATGAILADGSQVILESFICYLEWFGKVIPAQVIANDGKLPLLGTELLAERVLHIDYQNCRLTLE